jgi:glycine dehydrogenase subunit 2
VGEKLLPFLPSPRVLKESDGTYRLERPGERPTSIGRLRSYAASTGVLVRAFAYIFHHGGPGLEEVSNDAVLAANYVKARLTGEYDIPYARHAKHEFVAEAATIQRETGVRTLDIAKRLIDFGFHPPTIYFPLITHEGMLIEPTETEPVETLDGFVDALIAIKREAYENPEVVTSAPHTAPVRRLDEATAARQPNLRWRPDAARTAAAP